MEIKVLGPGCAKCNKTEKIIRKTVDELNLNVQIEKISDMLKISEYGVMATPAVVVNGEVKIVGKVPKKNDIKSWLEKSSEH